MEKAITVSGENLGEKTNKNFMNTLIEKAKNLLRTEPEKSLVAKGITTTDDTLTSEGEVLFLDFLYRANKDVFVKDAAVAAILAEKEEEKDSE